MENKVKIPVAILLFGLGGCVAQPSVQYKYLCRDLYLSADAYDRIAAGPNGAADIDRIYENAIWCEEIQRGN